MTATPPAPRRDHCRRRRSHRRQEDLRRRRRRRARPRRRDDLVRARQFTAIMGPSGSGKSTLLHCLAGLDSLTEGAVYIGDTYLAELNDKQLTELRRKQVGFIFQAYNLIPTLTAEENITLPLMLGGDEGRREVDRPCDRHRGPARPRRATGRASSRAVSSSASRSPARSPAGRRSSSPTSPPATSTARLGVRDPVSSCATPSTSSARRS